VEEREIVNGREHKESNVNEMQKREFEWAERGRE